MRIFVVSDTHGDTRGFINKVKTMEKPDLIIHLGDYVEDGIKIERELKIDTVIVKGNGDYYREDFSEDRVLFINDKRIFLTHGHKYNVRYGEDNLMYKGQEVNADIILFGHTHVPLFFEEANMAIMNPGSPSLPRGYSRKRTFGIIEIGEKTFGQIVEI